MVRSNQHVAMCVPCQTALDLSARGAPAAPLCDTCAVRLLHNMRVALFGRDVLAPMCEACAGKPAQAETGQPSEPQS